jgi:capsular exopolysaccharide synthesis family protein
MAGVVLGVGLVCLLESADHAVKAPEQLMETVSLPLLGVVPRMRRVARLCRGGHLWTPAWPDSIESDAFRSLRASVLGAERPERPHVTILVTSAKAGEGKSTTALNLAAAFARSGERTLLVDCDLRRPSLAEVFGVDSSVGLVEVLRSEIPWQRALVDCQEVANLSLLPAGTLGGLPIEILGSLELKQLLMALARNYHRVILDGPAIVGMAEGRLLGSMVDATLLVVRSGSHEAGTLRTTREIMAQSKASIVGVVFNDLSEDLHNWSSQASLSGARRSMAGKSRRPRSLGAPA